MKFKILILGLLASTVLGTRSYAHASFAATYFENKTPANAEYQAPLGRLEMVGGHAVAPG
jgi:hypothetical protein